MLLLLLAITAACYRRSADYRCGCFIYFVHYYYTIRAPGYGTHLFSYILDFVMADMVANPSDVDSS